MAATTDTEAIRQSAHVLIDAVHAFASGRGDEEVVAALQQLHETGAVTCSNSEDGSVVVSIQPLLKASLTLVTSLLTMVEVHEPEVETEQVLERLRSVVDLNAQL